MKTQTVIHFRQNPLLTCLYVLIVLAASTTLAGCKRKNSSSNPSPTISPIGEMQVGESVQWKRVNAIKSDLAYALDMPEDELCNELDSLPCFDQVHLSSLGGNEPFVLTQYEPVESPSAISAVAAERVALAACSNKVDSDLSSTATVFTEYDLSAISEPESTDYLEALDKQNTKLYQRLLVRDPTPAELELLKTLSSDSNGSAISNSDVAKLSCFTIATSSEFIFL